MQDQKPEKSVDLPAALCKTVAATFGKAGQQWLVDLPGLLGAAARRWELTIERPFPNLSYNYVATARRAGGQEVVLKLGVPNPELHSEATALRVFDGRGAVRLLDADPERGMLLLERLQPGHTLRSTSLLDDDQATRIAAGVMASLWRPPPENHAFVTINDWGRGFERLRARFQGGTGPFPRGMVEDAEAIYRGYQTEADKAVLLHGDLHHENILDGGDSWLAIDPKGIVGEAAYETGALLRNPISEIYDLSSNSVRLKRRAAILGELLGFDQERILSWGFAQAVLSAWWSLEDGDPAWDRILPLAARMRTSIR
jgi:streptomycin 6-kinase